VKIKKKTQRYTCNIEDAPRPKEKKVGGRNKEGKKMGRVIYSQAKKLVTKGRPAREKYTGEKAKRNSWGVESLAGVRGGEKCWVKAKKKSLFMRVPII